MKTYKEVGESYYLDKKTLQRFIKYMKLRWPHYEEMKCETGYAGEWALRFKYNNEFLASDEQGKSALDKIANEGGY